MTFFFIKPKLSNLDKHIGKFFNQSFLHIQANFSTFMAYTFFHHIYLIKNFETFIEVFLR